MLALEIDKVDVRGDLDYTHHQYQAVQLSLTNILSVATVREVLMNTWNANGQQQSALSSTYASWAVGHALPYASFF